MTQIIIEIPDNITQRVLNGIASRYHYSPILENGNPNPESKGQFAKRMIIEFLKKAVKDAEVEDARNDAATIAAESVDSDIQIT